MPKKKTSRKKKPAPKRRYGKASSKPRLPLYLLVFGIAAACIAVALSTGSLQRWYGKYAWIPDRLTGRIEALVGGFTAAQWQAVLFFGDEESEYLTKEFRRVTSPTSAEKKAFRLMEALLSGPEGRAVRTTPEHTRVRSVTIDDSGLATVDFSAALQDDHPGGSSSEIMTVFSIVNTLTDNIRAIKCVKILINGKSIDTLAGHVDCRGPIYPNMAIVR